MNPKHIPLNYLGCPHPASFIMLTNFSHMRHCYTLLNSLETQARRHAATFLSGLVLLLAPALLRAQAPCAVSLDHAEVSCNFADGNSAFELEIAFSWSGVDAEALNISVAGSTQAFPIALDNGNATLSLPLPGPGSGFPVEISVPGSAGCSADTFVDAIACTPPCEGDSDEIGGLAWQDFNLDGQMGAEPALPNVLVEAYDCEGQLAGSAFTNADGQWRITGLEPGAAYRVEFRPPSGSNLFSTFLGTQHKSNVQFTDAGNCTLLVGFAPVNTEEDCFNPDNPVNNCIENFNTLDWGEVANGAIPFPFPPFTREIGGDEIAWARSTDGGTPYTHRVYHNMLGGEQEYYLLEMEGDNSNPARPQDVGVVFSLNRPVQRLIVPILDIDVNGDAVDRVVVKAYLGGRPVALDLDETIIGLDVNYLGDGVFEGTTAVNDASTRGNVIVEFRETVDQVSITYTATASGAVSPGLQAIGLGDIAWCESPVPVAPQCTRRLDWILQADNAADALPLMVGTATVSVHNSDPSGIAASSGFKVDNDQTPLGGTRGFWPLAMNASAVGQYVESGFSFNLPVEQVEFAVLGIDALPGSYQDHVTVRAFLEGVEVPLALGNISADGSYTGPATTVLNANTYLGGTLSLNPVNTAGNVRVQIPEKIDSVVVRLEAGATGGTDPASQMIGISDLHFCICQPPAIQLGDYVWEDEDGNGVQNPCEPPMPGLRVSLYDANGQYLARTATNAEGRYTFTHSNNLQEQWANEGRILPGETYYIVFGRDDQNPSNQYIRLNNRIFQPTAKLQGEGAVPAFNDSSVDPGLPAESLPGDVPSGLPLIVYTAGQAGLANHSLDAGFQEVYFDLALSKTIDTTLTPPPFQPGSLVSFNITVKNEGVLSSTFARVIDYLPAGLSLVDAGPYHQSGNIFTLPAIAPGDSLVLTPTYRISPDFDGASIINAAEIGQANNAVNYADLDSQPDFINGNDAQGEDDYGFVEIPVEATAVFDLSLEKTVNGAGPFEPGQEVTFTLAVTNEGDLEAANVQLRDFIPNGLTVNDNNWAVADGEATLLSPIASIAPGETVARDITFSINAFFAQPNIVNRAEILSAEGGAADEDSTPGNNIPEEDDQDSELIVIQPTADLALEKLAPLGGPFAPGELVTFTFRIHNEGSLLATNIQLADYVPEGLTLEDNNWFMSGGQANLNTPILAVLPGASVNVPITFRIGEGVEATSLVNAGEIKSFNNPANEPDTDSTPGNFSNSEDDDATATIILEQPQNVFDLSLAKEVSSPGPFAPGQLVTFNIIVTNEGNLTAFDVGVIDYLPDGLSLADPDWMPNLSTALLMVPIPVIAPGASATVSITCQVENGMSGLGITNRAEIISGSNNLGLPDIDSVPFNGVDNAEDDNGSATIQVTEAVETFDLSLNKSVSSSGPFAPGSTVTFTLQVKNEGTLQATQVQLSDYIPQGLTLADADWTAANGIATLNNPIAVIPGGAAQNVDITFNIDSGYTGTSINNTAEIRSFSNPLGLPDDDSTPDNGDPNEDDFDNSLIAIAQQFDLALSKTVLTQGPYAPGQLVTYSLNVVNQGNITAVNVGLNDYYPFQQLLPADADWQAAGGNTLRLINPIPSIAPGQTVSVPITFQVRSDIACGAVATNCAEIRGAGNAQPDVDSTPANGSHDEDDDDAIDITISCQQEFDLSLEKTVVTEGAAFSPGQSVTFGITVTNEGEATATAVQVVDYLPNGTFLVDNNWESIGNNQVRLLQPIVNLAPGQSVTRNISLFIGSGYSGTTLTNFAEILSASNAAGSPDVDSTPGNGAVEAGEDDFDGATINMETRTFDLALSKSLKTSETPGPFLPGDEVVFRISVTNQGNVQAQNVQVRDYIPNGLILNDPNWMQNGSLAQLDGGLGSLAPGATISRDIRFVISGAFAQTSLTNFAEISAASNGFSLADVDSTPGNGAQGANEDDYDGAIIAVIQNQFDLALVKSLNTTLTPGPFSPGSAVTFRLTVSNQGDLTAQTVSLRDFIPEGLVLNDPAWSISGGNAVYNGAITNLQPGNSQSVNISFLIADDFTAPSISNFAEILSATNGLGLNDEDSVPGNGLNGQNEDDFDGAAITITYPQQTFDLALGKSLNTAATPGPFVPGSTVTFTITVENQGTTSAQQVQLADYVPLGLTLDDNNWQMQGATARLQTPIANIPVGGTVSRDITFTINGNFAGQSINNFAEIFSFSNPLSLSDEDSTPGNGLAGQGEDDFDSAAITVSPETEQVFDLSLAKGLQSQGPFLPGDLVTFVFTVTNEGNVTAQNIRLRDFVPQGMLPADLNWSSNGSTVVLNNPIASLAPGASTTVTLDLAIGIAFQGSSITNFGEISAATNPAGLPDIDSTPNNGFGGPQEDDFSSVTFPVFLSNFDLALVKTVATVGPFEPGDEVTFNLHVNNQGGLVAQNVELSDFVPQGLILNDSDWTLLGGVATLNQPIESISAGQIVTVPITFIIDADFSGEVIVNTAEILAAGNPIGAGDLDSTPGNGAAAPNEDDYDSATVIVTQVPEAVFDLALTKRVNTGQTPAPYALGDDVVYNITITNQGDFPAYNITVTDYIPAGLILDDANWALGSGMASRVIPGPVAPGGGTATVSIRFQIDPAYTGSVITNFAEISAADDDQVAGNTPPVDIDSPYDTNPANDAGGAPGTAADNAINGNGTGAPGSNVAILDEDDHDPAMIVLDNCDGLNAGINGTLEVCLTCTPDEVILNLFDGLGGNPSPGGFWTESTASGVSLVNPAAVDFTNVPMGVYTFVYTVGGMGGCPQQSATVTVNKEDISAFACNDQINVTFGTSCEIVVSPDMLLEGEDDCMNSLQVELFNEAGQSIGNTITGAEVGQLLFAFVVDPFCGNFCESRISVTDQTSPTIVCPTQEADLLCNELDLVMDNVGSLADLGQPQILDNCGDFNTVTFEDVMVMGQESCEDQIINRTFTVTDPAGNATQCTQQITFRPASLSDIMPFPESVFYSCTESYETDVAGNPLPDPSTAPQLDGFYGTYNIGQSLCNIGVTYEDSAPLFECEGTFRIVREWTLIDFCAPNGQNVETQLQIIRVGDVEGPTVTIPNPDTNNDGIPEPLVYSTGTFDCTAAIVVPMPGVTDNCSGWEVQTSIVIDEVVPLVNQFGLLIGYDTIPTVFQTIQPGESRFVTGIPIGCHTIRYKVTDDCNNFTVTEAPFCIEDQIEPAAVCNDDLNISLGGDGAARVFASDVDEGSNDNCEIATLEVRRLVELDPGDCSDVTDYYTDWGPFVDFTCCDAGRMVTIELRVTDIYGNQNICWLEVLVEDKINPFCIAPPSTSISCADLPGSFVPEDTQALEALFGFAEGDDDCGPVSVQEFAADVNLDDCGFGTIVRTFQAADAAGNLSTNTCSQVITVEQEFNYTIKFPKDEVSNCGVPSPDTILLNGMGCDMLSVNVEDEIFTPNGSSSDPACYKIFRRYRVQNMCEWDGISGPLIVGRNEDCDGAPGDEDVWVVRTPGSTFIDRDGNPNNSVPAFGTKGTSCDGNTNPAGYWRTVQSVGYWQYTQIIEVRDTEAPQISFTDPGQFCSINQVTCNANVDFPFVVAENCDPENLSISVSLDAGANGSIDFNVSSELSGTYPNYSIGGEYPIGSHAFVVTVEDGCGGNTAVATIPFEVVDCAAPTLTCLNGLTFNLQALPPDTDIDGDGQIDIAGAGIWASDFHINESDCSDDTIGFAINLPGETPDFSQTSLYFTCEDVGTIDVEVYFFDSAYNPEAVQPDGSIGGPNWDFCTTFIELTDNNSVCDNPEAAPMMAGLISRENDDAVQDVEVALSGAMSSMAMTSSNGTYEFAELPMGHDYTLTPSRNNDHRNGISTLDLITIQQHLLGISLLDSPYKRIAADANRSNAITTLDMIEIQKLILGEITEFTNNTSWRFVDREFSFPVPSNPWFSVFPESISVNDLDSDVMSNDFVAIKIGDVNNSATTTQFSGLEERSSETVALRLEDHHLQAGSQVIVPFAVAAADQLEGYQFTLEFDPAVLQLADVSYGIADENSLGLYDAAQGRITASWYDQHAFEWPEDGQLELFALTFEVLSTGGGALSSELLLSSAVTTAEAYRRDGARLGVALDFGQALPTGTASATAMPFRLHQNRPNPFGESTVIGFELPEAGTAQLQVYDLQGRLLKRVAGHYAAGYHEVALRREDLGTTGVLYYQLQAAGQTATRKMVLLK